MACRSIFCPLLILSLIYPVWSAATPAASLASLYSLTTSTSLPFPTATLASTDTSSFIVSDWSLSKGRVQDGQQDLAFVSDPFPNSPVPGPGSNNNTTSSSAPVLRVTYPAGSFSNNTGGAQFYSLWNTTDGSSFQSMLLSYEVSFDSGFDWVKGGKLPGLRGGPNANGCSGGNKPNGSDCFSTRVMWRTNAAGEVYAYIPTPNGICDSSNIICNDDFGTSIGRGSFGYATGQWNRITLLVQMNDPPNIANGYVALYFNDIQAISQSNLQLRSNATVNAGGLYFSTFFGGGDSSWATPIETHTYFRDFQLWGSSSPSNMTGSKVTSAGSPSGRHGRMWVWVICVVAIAVIHISGVV